MNPARLCSSIVLATWVVLGAGCSQKTGPLLVFEHAEDLPIGAEVIVTVENSNYSEAFKSPPRTLRLHVDSSAVSFKVIVSIEINAVPCSETFWFMVITGQSPEFQIDLSVLVAACVSGTAPGTDGGDASTDGGASLDADGSPGGADGPGDGGDASDAADALPDVGADAGECAGYCAVMATACPESYQTGDCAELCAAFEWSPGETGDRGRNSLACRMTWAHLAAGDTAAAPPSEADRKRFCLAAGASGSNTCGSLCEDYCTAANLYCPSLLRAINVDDCTRLGCMGPAVATDPAISAGDTLDCRIYWIGKASADTNLCAWGALAPQAGSPCQ